VCCQSKIFFGDHVINAFDSSRATFFFHLLSNARIHLMSKMKTSFTDDVVLNLGTRELENLVDMLQEKGLKVIAVRGAYAYSLGKNITLDLTGIMLADKGAELKIEWGTLTNYVCMLEKNKSELVINDCHVCSFSKKRVLLLRLCHTFLQKRKSSNTLSTLPQLRLPQKIAYDSPPPYQFMVEKLASSSLQGNVKNMEQWWQTC
jgi:hypothetical protein